MTRWLRRHTGKLTAAGVVSVLALVGWAGYRHQYPYGRSRPAVIRVIAMELEQYANDHNGHYPAGEASPEASLSLLHFDGYAVGADLLRGNSVPSAAAERDLDAGKLLSPDTCGWHYVAGLTKNDDQRLALLWDKERLGAHGERTDGTTEVAFVGGVVRTIPAEQWEHFLDEQRQLVAQRGPDAK